MKKVIKKFPSMGTCLAVFFGILVVALFVFSGSPAFVPRASASTSSTPQTQGINISVNEVISLSLSSSTLYFSGALTPGTPVFTSSTATISTNATSGWSLYVNRSNAAGTLQNSASSTYYFPDAAAWTQGAPNSSISPGSNLSFRANLTGTTAGDYNATYWGASDASGTAMYAGFPTANQLYASTSTFVGSAQAVVMQLRADSAPTTMAGSYSGNIVVTALALP
jgi:hypothetical protein